MDASQMLQLYLALWLAVLGAVLGSFLCCVADRYAAGEGLPTGRSRCDHCGHVLGPADLVPVLSYVLHRGKCRYCGGAIPVRCLVAELAGAGMFAALGLHFGPCAELVMWLVLGALLLTVSLIDGACRLIPDGLLLGAIISRAVFLLVLGQPLWSTLGEMALGALGISVPLLLLSLLMDHVLQKESLGGGDIKLLFVLSLYMTWMEMLLLLFMGCVLALLWIAGPGRQKLGEGIPLGPFLAAAWLVVLLFGGPLIQWYQQLLI